MWPRRIKHRAVTVNDKLTACRTRTLIHALRCLALFTQAKLAKPLPRVDAIVVPIAERKLHAIATHMLGTKNGQILGYCPRIEYPKPRHLADAVGTHTLRSEVLDRINADVTVIPSYRDLSRAGLLYLERCRHNRVRRNLEARLRGSRRSQLIYVSIVAGVSR